MAKSKPKPKRAVASALEACTTPPAALKPQQTLAKLVKAEGNHLYSVILPRVKAAELGLGLDLDLQLGHQPQDQSQEQSQELQAAKEAQEHKPHLVELTSALRSTVFLKRNGYVLVDLDRELLGGRENKIVGIVVGVVLGGRDEREWRAMAYWPEEFTKGRAWGQGGSDDEEGEDQGPRMPVSDDEGEQDDGRGGG